ncbi:MAG: hypothetical protein DIU69_08665 [Bacillota bacterium]|nr:MAG: hypothetical protein DIU69_08665 [Bacillota bacterium]
MSPNRHKAKDGSQWGIIEARIRTVTGGIVAHTICTWDGDNGRANAEFAAHAREDLPALVAEVERLWDFVGELRNELRRWRDRAAELERSAVMDAEDELDEAWREGKAAGLDEAADELEALLNELEASRRAE